MSAPPAYSSVTTAACTHCATPLAGRFCHVCGQDSLPAETAMVSTFIVAVTWLAFASRRLFAERWPIAIAKGMAIVLTGFIIDQAMFVTAVFVTFNLA